jgi:hypothetical protein
MYTHLIENVKHFKTMLQSDKNILIHAIETNNHNLIKNMSIFSTYGCYKNLENYVYYETNDNEPIYFLNWFISRNTINLFLDKHKKIIFDSNINSVWFNTFVHKVDSILNDIKNIDLSNAICIDCNIISIQRWEVTLGHHVYGHYKDETFSMHNFHNKYNSNFKILTNYHTDDKIVKYPINNFKIISNYLFGDNEINAYDYGNNILKFNKLCLITHKPVTPTFHMFDINSRNKILSSIKKEELFYEKVFINRTSKSWQHYTNLEYIDEVEQLLYCKNFKFVNPEMLILDDFINTIKNANKVIIYWGSALTNLIYLKPNTNVFIIKTKSYVSQNYDIFEKIFENYKLNITVLDESHMTKNDFLIKLIGSN